MSEIDLNGMSRDELTDLLAKIIIRLRKFEVEEIKGDFITKSKSLRLELEAKDKSRMNRERK